MPEADRQRGEWRANVSVGMESQCQRDGGSIVSVDTCVLRFSLLEAVGHLYLCGDSHRSLVDLGRCSAGVPGSCLGKSD